MIYLPINESMSHLYPQHSLAASDHEQRIQPPLKKKRGLPGNPDPNSEVVALSPKTLMATHRFICEVCKKGFQRDQNLQLHRRGHNLPWKLKQRSNKEVVTKKVYVCPEPSCVHHDPSRALGDLTGIKKHFCRKHGEKKWKCDKCSKKYAVQSDWKAHSKICGTREYKCDCGTIFSRRDSFITHRAFCDALMEETTRRVNPTPTQNPHLPPPPYQYTLQHFQAPSPSLSIKKESFKDHNIMISPCWSGPLLPDCCPNDTNPTDLSSSPLLYGTTLNDAPNRSSVMFQTIAEGGGSSPHMSATAILQKAADIGVRGNQEMDNSIINPPSQSSFLAGFCCSGDSTIGTSVSMATFTDDKTAAATSFIQDMLAMGSLSSGFDMPCTLPFDDGLNMMLNRRQTPQSQFTRDFLGLKPLVPRRSDFIIPGLEHQINSSPSRYQEGEDNSQATWHG